jgi:hypothetical protein
MQPLLVETFLEATILTSEDMAMRVIDGCSARVIATLPPPPNSKVYVLDVCNNADQLRSFTQCELLESQVLYLPSK